jgi:hypothetical protein
LAASQPAATAAGRRIAAHAERAAIAENWSRSRAASFLVLLSLVVSYRLLACLRSCDSRWPLAGGSVAFSTILALAP